MRVRVDEQLCEGNAVCERVAPAVFRVGDDDRAVVLIERPGADLRDAVEQAVRRCPRQAIAIVED
jgi:ferredoxin